MRVLLLDKNHPLLKEGLEKLGCICDEDYTSSKEKIESIIGRYEGLVIRSRFTIDRNFIKKAINLKFIGRVGAGLENIDAAFTSQQGIELIAAPEGNRNAVGEHTLGMILSLFNNFTKADNEVRQGKWLREENRGIELDGKTIGIIGYGNTGKAFAKKLQGFNVKTLCYDIKVDLGDKNATQVSLEELKEKADVISLHIPETPLTLKLVNENFINSFKKPFWLINTSRGNNVVTEDLVNALKSGKILGAGLDVLEYEKSSFEHLFLEKKIPDSFKYLVNSDKVLLTPHIAGWTQESKVKLAQTIVDKVESLFFVN